MTRIAGFIILRNAVLNDYPFVEAIRSVIPLVDELVVSVDPGDDNTLQVLQQLQEPKIRLVETRWDLSMRGGGILYAHETNKAMQHVSKDADWLLYIQADEVLHENDYSAIRSAAEKYRSNSRVEGLLFKYLHFYGTYDYVGNSRKWYRHEVRLIRNDPGISSYKDAQGFRVGERKINVVPVNASVYHYGWVKSPDKMKRKLKEIRAFYSTNDADVEWYKQGEDYFDFGTEYDVIARFDGTHPGVMKERISRQNWQVELDVSRQRLSFKGKLLFLLERLTGKRLFEFKNYRVIKP